MHRLLDHTYIVYIKHISKKKKKNKKMCQNFIKFLISIQILTLHFLLNKMIIIVFLEYDLSNFYIWFKRFKNISILTIQTIKIVIAVLRDVVYVDISILFLIYM